MIRSDHENYDHYSSGMINRLDGFFGRVDERINSRIASWIFGQRVLEIGCGFGQLVEQLRKAGYSATGIDMLQQCVVAGRRRFPEADLRIASSERLDFADRSVDTVVLKDTIHHVYGESDIHKFLTDVRRVCRKRIIVSDPNPTTILLLARRLIRHRDPVCSAEQAEQAISQAGFVLVHKSFGEVLAFPLSGGFVGKPMVPNNMIGSMVLGLDSLMEKALQRLHLNHHACWRYLLVADLDRSV